jgi:Plasmid pRiA4b ORF-3-like protein
MTESDGHEAQVYQLRAVLRGISPLIWRRLLVRSDSTVAQLHEVLQIAFGWDDEHLNRFEIRGREYAVYRDGGGMIGIDARDVRLCDLKLRRLERFVYEYDFGDSWIHDLRLETTLPLNPRKIYPVCVAGKCSAPPEDCGGSLAFMANRHHYAGFGRGQSAGDLDEFMDEFDDEESDSFSDYDPERFDRRQINRALSKLATGSYAEALDEIHNPGVDRIPRRAATQRPDPDH